MGITSTAADFCFRSDSDLAQLGAIRAGIGVGMMQTKIAQRDANLQRILLAFQFPMEIWLAIQASNRSVARVRVVFDGLAQALKTYGSASVPPGASRGIL